MAAALACGGCRSSGAQEGIDTGPIVLANGEARVLAIHMVEPRFQPGLEALQKAVNSGDEREARAILERIDAMGPADAAYHLARGFERILDGRAAVEALDLRLDAAFARPTGGAGVATVAFTARALESRSLAARPGPGVLHVTTIVVEPSGAQTRRVEIVPLGDLGTLVVGPDTGVRIELCEVPIVMPAGSLALRAQFEVDLRAGSVRTGAGDTAAAATSRGRDLPAMRWHVEGAEIVMLAKELGALDLAQPGDLARLSQSAQVDRHAALWIAVRVPPAEREAALDELARASGLLSEPALVALTGALRWLASDANLGEDAGAWRAWLRERARRAERGPDLILPRSAGPPASPSALAESTRAN